MGEEATSQRNYEELMHAVENSVTGMETSISGKEEQKSEAVVDLAAETQKMEDDHEQRFADMDFFNETNLACQEKKVAFDKRVSLRNEELDGINKALEFLTSNEARRLF